MSIKLPYIIYSYFEEDLEHKKSLIYFLKNGYLPDLLYIIVINGEKCSVDIPKKNNIIVIFRENIGFDFQGYYTGIMYLKEHNMLDDNHYYLFINCSVRGPFIPLYSQSKMRWYQPYIDLMSEKTKLVGSTITYHIHPHVQSCVFMMDLIGVNLLLSHDFFKVYKTKTDVITNQEIGMSRLFIENGWNINCLVKEYQGIDYTDPNLLIHTPFKWSWWLCPYEVIFAKIGHPSDDRCSIDKLTERHLYDQITNQWICKQIRYGLSIDQSIDVTDIIKKLKVVDLSTINLNKVFGDPFPKKPKKLIIIPNMPQTPIILNEISCYLEVPNKKYQIVYNETLDELHLMELYFWSNQNTSHFIWDTFSTHE